MSVMQILEFPDPRLRTVAKPVEVFDDKLSELVDDMLETMYAESGIGLAATQVNEHIRLLVMDTSEERNEPSVFINPQITESDGHQIYEEGCLSVPGIYANVERAENVTVKAFDAEGNEFEKQLDGLNAVCLQHEMDHLRGKLFVDYLSPLKRQMVRKKLEKARKQAMQDAQSGVTV